MRNPTLNDEKMGEEAILAGLVGAVILAGGEGTRLNFEHPKALYPIFYGKTLLQIFIEKVVASQKKHERELSLAVMCSKAAFPKIQSYLKENSYFGLQNLSLFIQTEDFLFDEKMEKTKILSPNGNGAIFECLEREQIFLEQETVTITPIDNPLAHPFDEKLIGFHLSEKNDASIVVIDEKLLGEKMGALLQEGDKLKVIEYTKQCDNALFFNTGLLCFSKEFMSNVAGKTLPNHLVQKSREESMIYKNEKLIFDALDYADRVGAVHFLRSECFAPLKEKEGPNGVVSVREALDKHILKSHNKAKRGLK